MKKQNESPTTLTPQQWIEYEDFVRQNKAAFRRIANATRGEYEPGDIETEALMMAIKLRDNVQIEIAFDSVDYLQMLLARLYTRLGKYSHNPTRFAVRLDQGIDGDEDAPHPLANKLSSDEGRDPLAILIERESSVFSDLQAANFFSLAAAYLRLLEHFKCELRAVADHLLLTVEETNRHIGIARRLASHQHPLRLPLPHKDFLPGPWRKFRPMRAQLQMVLDLGDEPELALD